MKHFRKRRLSLLLAVIMCLTASGVSALAAPPADAESYNAAEYQTEGAEDGTSDAAAAAPEAMMPTPADSGADAAEGDAEIAGAGAAGTADSDDRGISAGDSGNDAAVQNGDEDNDPGEGGGTPAVTSAPVPDGFFAKVEIGKEYDEKNGKIIPFDEKDKDVKWSADCALRFDYRIPEGADMKAGVKYTFSVKAPLILSGDFDIKNESGTVVANGTFTPSGDGTVEGVLVFSDQDYLNEDTEGYFYLHTKFDESKISGNGRQNVTVEIVGTAVKDETSVDFEAPVSEAKVSLVKNADSAKLLAQHQIEWTVKATPSVSNITDEHVNSLVITDDLKANKLDYVKDSAAVVTKSGEAAEGTVKYDEESGILTFTGQGDDLKAAAWPITLTFRTQYDPDDIKNLPLQNGKLVYNNKASVKITAPQYVKDPETGSVTLVESTPEDPKAQAEAEASSRAEISYVTMTKEGALASGQKVSWTVKVRNNLLQKKPELVDTLPQHMLLVAGSVKLNGKVLDIDDYSYVYEDSEGRYKLTVRFDEGKTDEQTLEYETVFDDEKYDLISEVSNIINKADLYMGDDHNFIVSKTSNVHIGNSLMTKSGVYDKQTHTVTWTIVMKTDGMSLKGMSLKDIFGQTINGKNVAQTYVPGSMKIDGKTVENGKDVQLVVSEDGKSFTLTGIRDDHPESEKITYKTVLDDSDAAREFWGNNFNGTFKITNTMRLYAQDGLEAKAEVTATVNGSSKMLQKDFVSYDYANRSVEWKLTINQNQMKLTNGVIMDTLSSADWAFDEDAGIKLMQNGKDVTSSVGPVTYGTDENGLPVMTVKLPDTQAGDMPFVMTYHTKLVNEDILLSNAKFKVKNTSVLTGDEVKSGGVSVSASQDIGQNVLSKSITQKLDANNELTWTVDVNKNLATIKTQDGTGKIGIVDTLQQGLTYVDGSLKIVPLTITADKANGKVTEGGALEEGDDKDYTVSYDSVSRELKVMWNSSSLTGAYRVTFRTLVMVSGTYSNSVSFTGISEDPGWDHATAEKYTAKFSGGFTSLPERLGALLIKKTDGTTGAKLQGAKFTIKNSDGLLIGEFITDENGEINAVLPVGNYIIEETVSPDNYVLPTVHRWEKSVKSKQLVELDVKNYQVKNIATISPKVTKKIEGSGAPADTEFTFVLAAENGAPMPAEDTVSVKGEGTVSFGQIEYNAEGVYSYKITEQDGKANRFTYDTQPHKLTVTVTRNLEGQLEASAVYDDDAEADTLVITNKYTRKSSGGGSSEPSKPVTPDQPEQPDKPEQPDQPETPDQPEKPDTPSTPEAPDQPSEPDTPDKPSQPSVPVYVITKVPKPSPSSPEEIFVIDEEGVPLGDYFLELDNNGNYVYVDEDGNILEEPDVPLSGTVSGVPRTGNPLPLNMLSIMFLICAGGAAVLYVIERKKYR